MKTDPYTKTLLTVIAVCLVICVLRDVPLVPPAHAQEALRPPRPMPAEVMQVDIVRVAGAPVMRDAAWPVTVRGTVEVEGTVGIDGPVDVQDNSARQIRRSVR